MTEALVIVLVVLSLGCGVVLAAGGTKGLGTSNPWWLLPAAASVVLTLHVLGYLLEDSEWITWVAVTLALAGSVAVGIREWSLWNDGTLPRPGTRESVMETVLVIVGVIGAQALQPFLPEASRVALIALTLIPLLMVRWALTRIGRSDRPLASRKPSEPPPLLRRRR